MKTCKGFTLIELMIVVAIVAILATVVFGPKKPKTDEGGRPAMLQSK